MKNPLLYLSKKNHSVNLLCVSLIANIQLWFTTWLTNTTFQNGGMHNVQRSQTMLELGVYELAHFNHDHFNIFSPVYGRYGNGHFYTPCERSSGGYIGITLSVRLSVRPSVCPFVCADSCPAHNFAKWGDSLLSCASDFLPITIFVSIRRIN